MYRGIPGLPDPTRYTVVCLRVISISAEVGDAMNGTHIRGAIDSIVGQTSDADPGSEVWD
jgi:hypothetical protein